MSIKNKLEVKVGYSSCGIAAGAREVLSFFEREIAAGKLPVTLKKTGCAGLCYREVLVDVIADGEKCTYGEVTPELAAQILQSHLVKNRPLKEHVILDERGKGPEAGFLAGQKRIVLRNCGLIDPESFEDYLAAGGYEALKKALSKLKPEAVIAEVKAAGLRGRGGAGFPAGMKWEFARNSPGDEKYLVCNADEGDPGAFMDRSVLEGDPHSVIEGMLIAAYAIGASHGYIYARAEYPLAIKRLKIAIGQAEKAGFLGENILKSGFSFELTLKEGAGAFVCGEETALIASIEGKRGMPRLRPPFPTTAGLWGKPTCINNVETLANVAWIIREGAKVYAAIGTEKSKGTKVFALTGKVNKSGLIEVPMGVTLRDVILKMGGGIIGGAGFKAVQIGGPSGGCLPESLLDTAVDYDSLTASGAIMGSGGMVVADDKTCMLDLARFFLDFVQKESCGKCVPCRVGTRRMLEFLEKMTAGQAVEEDLEKLEMLAREVKSTSLCGLGQTSPNPVLTTLKYFKDEYKEHIKDKKCRAGVCSALLDYSVDAEKCTGCGVCKRECPSDAITGEKKEAHIIDTAKCIKCGVCFDKCKFGAIVKR